MCGICCILYRQCTGKDYGDLKHLMKYGQISHRGPDATESRDVTVNEELSLTLTGHVLHLRGQLTPQPLQHQNGDLLLWNGEIFDGIEVGDEENDTEILLELLTKDLSPKHILDTMAMIQGPWSFIYWQNATKCLYFGRDMFGRRSLLWHLPRTSDDVFMLSSVQIGDYEYEEVPSVGLFCLQLKNETATMTMFPRDEAVWPGTAVRVRSSDISHFCTQDSLAPNFKVILDEAQFVPMSIPKLNMVVHDKVQCRRFSRSLSVTEIKDFAEVIAKDKLMKEIADLQISPELKEEKDETNHTDSETRSDLLQRRSHSLDSQSTADAHKFIKDRLNSLDSETTEDSNERKDRSNSTESETCTNSDDQTDPTKLIVSNNKEIAKDPKKFLFNMANHDLLMNRLSDQLLDILLQAVKTRVYNQVDLSVKIKPCDRCNRRRCSTSHNSEPEICDKGGFTMICDEKLHSEQNCIKNVNTSCHGIGGATKMLSGKTNVQNLTSKTHLDSGQISTSLDGDVQNTSEGGLCSDKKVINENEKIGEVGHCTCDNKLYSEHDQNSVIKLDSMCSLIDSGKNDSATHLLTNKVCEEKTADVQNTKTFTDGIFGDAKVAVLFSGGIDSAVITALVDRCLPEDEPVDLLNVAFEQKKKPQQQRNKGEKRKTEVPTSNWNVPDRITGYTALKELNPNRRWNFVEVNVTVKELQEVRTTQIKHLLYPLETVLDDSIGCAVWFAARGCGILGNTDQIGKPYKSTAKVILCGMGADEQLAGYSRHRGRFMELGWHGLLEEIDLEVNRISSRNLGRDDRIISDHGKESRFPFLDENVVEYLQQLPIQYKADLSLPRGVGEKLLLRLCAVKLGLVNTATFPKRAIQFGSRIAKTENNKEKGSDKCSRLTTAIE